MDNFLSEQLVLSSACKYFKVALCMKNGHIYFPIEEAILGTVHAKADYGQIVSKKT